MYRFNFSAILLPTLTLLTAFLFSACHDEHDCCDTTKPTVEILSPPDNSFTVTGDNLDIRAQVEDNSLHEVKLEITKAADSTVVFTKSYSVHGKKSFSLNETWLVPKLADVETEVIIRVIAEDQGDNLVSDFVRLSVFPN
jgi:hypothetical protein